MIARNEEEMKMKRVLTSLLLVTLLVTSTLSMVFVARPASAASFVGTNYSGKIIQVDSGGIFVLRTELVWDEPDFNGYYGVTIIWEDNNRADENFTVMYARAFIDNDGDNLPGPSPIWLENFTELLYGSGTSGTRWTFKIYNTTGDPTDGYFDVEIYMQAASRGTPHRAPWENHWINKSGWGGSIDYAESTVGSTTPAVTTIKVVTVDEAIDKGVAWLAAKQNPDGSWGSYYPVGQTGLAVLKLEEHAVDEKYGYGLPSPFDPAHPYRENVENGLNYIFLKASVINVSVQPAGNPDTNGNGKGVNFSSWGDHKIYETSIAMMAIAASRAPERVVNVPGSPVDNWKYKDVLQDAVDYLAWGQTDWGYGIGGWDYEEMDNGGDRSDQSITGWAAFGLGFAESPAYGFMCTIPAFVKTEMNIWIDYIQNDVDGDTNDGGAGYTDPGSWVNILKTGHLLYNMKFVGDTAATPRVQDAVAYIVRHWNDANVDPGWRGAPGEVAGYHAMYDVMKGLTALGIHVIDGIDWQTEFEEVLIDQQWGDGSWPVSYWDDGGDNILSTEWALLTLQKVAPPIVIRGVQVVIEPSPPAYLEDENGGTVEFTITVVNTGNVQENFQLARGDNAGWTLSLDNTWLLVPKGENRTTKLTVAIPPNATGCTWDNIWVKATSKDNVNVFDNKSCLAHVKIVRGVQVVITPPSQENENGGALKYDVSVMNLGNVQENFQLTRGDNAGWTLSLDDNWLLVPKGETGTTKLTVNIPSNATGCTWDNIWVKATSKENAEVFDNESCLAHVKVVAVVRGVQVAIMPPSQENENGGMLAYTVTVTNLGNVPENFQLAKGDNAGWTLALENTWLLVPKGENRTTKLTVNIPANATGCTWDSIWVKATSKDNVDVWDNESCLAHVKIVRGVQVVITPPSQENENGGMLTYIVTVINLGNVPENFQLEKGDNAGWALTLENTWLLVPKGENGTTKLTVNIPANATGCTWDNIWVKATSEGDPSVYDVGYCWAHVEARYRVDVLIEPYEQSGISCTWLEYKVTVMNIGDLKDNYNLTVDDVLGWEIQLENRIENVPPGENRQVTLRVHIPENAVPCTHDNITVTAAGTGVSDSDICIAHAIEKVVGWDAFILATFSGGSDDAIFGVRPDASSGFDNAYDLPEAPAPPEPPYIQAYFYYPGNAPDPTRLHRSCLAPENLMEWPLRIEYADNIENITLTWNIENVPTEYSVLLYRGADLLADMRVEDNYAFEASTGTYDFRIVVGAIVRGVQVVIEPPSQENENGGTLTYIVTVLNLGNIPENFQLEKGDNAGWALSLDDDWLLVPKGESRTTKLTVNIPANATGCTWDSIWVKATSKENAEVFDNESCLAHVRVVEIVRGVQVVIEPSYRSGAPEATLFYTVTVKNTGNVPDNYVLTVSDNAGWGPTLENNLLEVPAGENRQTTLRVTIPASAEDCTRDNIIVTATGTEVSDYDTCIAHATVVIAVRRVFTSIYPQCKSGVPCTTLTYSLTVRNLGNGVDSYVLSVSDTAGWGPTLSTYLLEDVESFGKRIVTVSVHVPEGAAYRARDVITVVVSSQADPTVSSSASCIAYASSLRE